MIWILLLVVIAFVTVSTFLEILAGKSKKYVPHVQQVFQFQPFLRF